MTFVWSVAAGLLLGGTTRVTGCAMAAMAVAIAWGRIYAGVHWPFDMAGGVLAGTSGALAAHLYARPVTAMLERIGEPVHAVVMGRLRAP